MQQQDPLPIDDLVLIDQQCIAFEAAIKAGSTPRIEDFLSSADTAKETHRASPSLRQALFRELLTLEIEYRFKEATDQPPDANEYTARFSEFQDVIHSVLAQLRPESEQRIAETMGPPTGSPSADGVALRIRCPHCRQPVQVVDDDSLADVVCDSCGSHFNLIAGTETYSSPAGKRKMIGDFELIETVGVGQFGAVWKARDRKLERLVAIKIPRRGSMTPAEIDFFFREARAAAQLRHANVVSVHEAGREGDTIFIVSDYIDGANLKEWLSGQRLTVREATELCIKVANALQHAHESGVVHRDLKPGNIMLDRDGEPHVTDFGLAKRETGEVTMTIDGHIMGTPAYMPPEQARGEGHQADRRSDIYSLGVVLFELLTGELPFRGQQRMLIVQILDEEAPSPRKFDPRVPRDLETICLKCMEKDSDRRYQTMEELADDLRRFLDGVPVHARPISGLQRSWRWCKRKPMVASLSALLLLALTTGIGVSTWFAIEADQRADELNFAVAEKDLEARRADANAEDSRLAAKKARQNEQRANASEAETRRLLYRSDMRQAFNAKASNNVGEIRQLLLRHVPQHGQEDNRNFAWFHLWEHIHPHRGIFPHGAAVTAMDLTRDGLFLASGGGGVINIWNTSTGRLVSSFAHARWIRSLSFSPDSDRLIAGGWGDGTVHIWDWRTSTPATSLVGMPGNGSSAAWSPDGQRVALTVGGRDMEVSEHESTVTIFDAATGDRISAPGNWIQDPDRGLDNVSFSPSGRYLATSTVEQGRISLFDLESKEVIEIPGSRGGGWINAWGVEFSRDGQQLATCGRDGVHVWKLPSGELAQSFPLREYSAVDATFSANGNQLYAVGDKQIAICDLTTGQYRVACSGHDGRLLAVKLSPDQSRLFTGGEDGYVRIHDLPRPPRTVSLDRKGHVRSPDLQVRPNGDAYTIAGTSVVRCNLSTGRSETTMLSTRQISHFHVKDDGLQLAVSFADGEVVIHDLTNRENANTLLGRRVLGHHDKHGCPVVFSPGGKFLAAMPENFRITLLDSASLEPISEIRRTTSGEAPPTQMIFSHDGEMLAVADGGNSTPVVEVFAVKSGELLSRLNWHTSTVNAVCFSARDGRLATAGADGVIRIGGVRDGVATTHALRGHTGAVTSLAVSPDGSLLASASLDGTVRLWDLESLESLGSVTHVSVERTPPAVRFSHDGTILITADYERLGFHREASLDTVAAELPLAQVLQSSDFSEVYRELIDGQGRTDLASLLIGHHINETVLALVREDLADAAVRLKQVRERMRDDAAVDSVRLNYLRYRASLLTAVLASRRGDDDEALKLCDAGSRAFESLPQEIRRMQLALDRFSTEVLASYRERKFENADAQEISRLLVRTILDVGGEIDIRLVSGERQKIARSDLIPNQPFQIVKIWYLRSTTISAADWLALANTQQVEELYLYNSSDTGAFDWTILPKMKHLRRLVLDGWVPLDESVVEAIASCPNLTDFCIFRCQFEPALLRRLSDLKKLTSLQFNLSVFGDDHARHLGQLDRLLGLNLLGCTVTDEGLRQLSGLKSLEAIYLDRCRVGDEGLRHLTGLKKLKYLGLSGTNTTPDLVDFVSQMQALETLDVSATRVIAPAVKEIQQLLPNCSVIVDNLKDAGGTVKLASLNEVNDELDKIRSEITDPGSRNETAEIDSATTDDEKPSASERLTSIRIDHLGSELAVRAAMLVRQLPSPFDQLDAVKWEGKLEPPTTGDGSSKLKLVGMLNVPTDDDEPRRSLNGILVSADGTRVVGGGLGLFEWTIPSGEARTILRKKIGFKAFAFDHATKGAWSSGPAQRTIARIDIDTGKQTRFQRFADDGNAILAVSANGIVLAHFAQGKPIQVTDLLTSRSLQEIPVDSEVISLTLSDDGRLLAVGTVMDSAMKLIAYDVLRGNSVFEVTVPIKTELPDGAVAFSPDSQVVAFRQSGDGETQWQTRRIRLSDAKELKPWIGGTQNLAFSPDGRWLARSARRDGAAIDVFDRKEQGTSHTVSLSSLIEPDETLPAIRFAPDSRHILAATSGGRVFVLRVEAP